MILDSNDDDSEESDFLSIAGEDVDVHLNHYRVPKLSNYGPYSTNNPPKSRSSREQVKFSNEGKIMTLTELAAQKVACHLPFGLVEHFDPPVPEPMQCRIAFWSFPQDEEDIKLYTCLASGNADVFYRAEELICQNAVRDMLQVGFHLSANVQFLSDSEDLEIFRVAITFDRRRITSCSCSCMTSTFWCQHVVAVCLQRIRKPLDIKLRAPVSESLQRLEKNQLQKFAQYLINELPQQILPAAQKLLDELLSGDEAIINKNPAAPDPTAGATMHEQTSWCLDYTHISMDIHRILVKQCTAQPTVCSDIQSLHVTAPPAATEYSQLLRPIRGREPEGIWNLISIVGEMMKRRDPNLFLLLDIMTEEVMKFDKIVTWWFEAKVSLHSGSTIHFANPKTSQCTSQYSCSNFCDEIVHLWRLAALNPSANLAERQRLEKKFFEWHLAILKKHSSLTEATASINAKSAKRNFLELFPGFKSAMEGSQVDWSDWDDKRGKLVTLNDQQKSNNENDKPAKTSKRRKRRSKASKQADLKSTDQSALNEKSSNHDLDGQEFSPANHLNEQDEDDNVEDRENLIANDSSNNDAPTHQIASDHQRAPLNELNGNEEAQIVRPPLLPEIPPEIEPDLQVYFMDGHPDSPLSSSKPESLEDLIKVNVRRLADPLETMYAKVEGLNAHGHVKEARRIAKSVATDILSQKNYPSLKQLYTLPRRRKKKGSLDNQMSIVASETLAKISFLCNVLVDDVDNHDLIFRLIMFAVGLRRSPAATKPLEVKLISQKQELIMSLKNIVLHEEQLIVIREKAESICNQDEDVPSDALTTLILGTYIFEVLVLSRLPKPQKDADLGFQAALNALGIKINISEVDHPLLCEGIRRQRGDLALALITHFKDDQEKLDLILKQLLDKDLVAEVRTCCEKSPISRKGLSQSEPNQPSEASAHFMFELAKTVFDKAGGNSTTAHLFRPQLVAQNGVRGMHRKLHMCTLRIALYALGLQNRASPNWMQRTYNGRASFILEQALEIGLPAIKFLCENWQGYLTPVEAASVADKAGSSNDLETKRIAAEMAKSCLKFANFLDYNAVSRILVQCKEQNIEMIEEACSEIEQVAETENVCADVLFATARAWHGLYLKSITNERHCANSNLYQLNNPVQFEQDNGASDWLASSGQPQEKQFQQQFNEPVNNTGVLCTPNDFIQTTDTPIYENIDYRQLAAFRVGIKALDSLKLYLHMGNRHNPKKIDEILWLLGVSKSLGHECLFKFSQSVTKNITDPYTLQIIIIEIIRYFDNEKVPQTSADRINLLSPMFENCLNKCLKQVKDLMKHSSNDQKSYIETILEVVQSLTHVSRTVHAAQYYWEILNIVEQKMDTKRNNRRGRIHINIGERRDWLKKFSYEEMNFCDCIDCWNSLSIQLKRK